MNKLGKLQSLSGTFLTESRTCSCLSRDYPVRVQRMNCAPPALDTQCIEVSSFKRQDATFDSRGIEGLNTDLDKIK